MNVFKKRAGVLAGALVASAALLSISVASASASPVNAYWVNPGSVAVSGSLTLKLNGTNEKTCTVRGPQAFGTAWNFEKFGTLEFGNKTDTGTETITTFNCTGSTNFWLDTFGETLFETSYSFAGQTFGVNRTSPYGTYSPKAYSTAFVNASGGTASYLSFNNTKVGTVGLSSLTATGNLTIKRSNGENITLTH